MSWSDLFSFEDYCVEGTHIYADASVVLSYDDLSSVSPEVCWDFEGVYRTLCYTDGTSVAEEEVVFLLCHVRRRSVRVSEKEDHLFLHSCRFQHAPEVTMSGRLDLNFPYVPTQKKQLWSASSERDSYSIWVDTTSKQVCGDGVDDSNATSHHVLSRRAVGSID